MARPKEKRPMDRLDGRVACDRSFAKSDEALLSDLIRFRASCAETGKSDSTKSYAAWACREEKAGRKVESSSTMTMRFVSWNNAKRLAIAATGEVPAKPIPDGKRFRRARSASELYQTQQYLRETLRAAAHAPRATAEPG